MIVGVGTNPGGDEEAWIARLGSGLITPNGVTTSVGTVAGGVVDIEAGLQGAADNMIEACLAHRGEDLTRSLCPYFVGDGSLLVDDPAGGAGSAVMGLAWRNEDGFRIGAGPALVGGWASLDGGGHSAFWGYGVGAFAAYGRPNAGPQFALAGTFFDLHADIDRAYMNGASTDISSGSTDGLGGSAEIELGMRFAAGDAASFMPYANLRASYLRLDGYTETGGGFPAEIDPMEAARTTLRLGLESRFAVSPSCEFFAKAAWGHDLSVDGPDISGNIIGIFDFAVPGTSAANDFVEVALGTSWVTDSGHVATTLGGAIGTDGSSPAVFGRLTINR